MADHTTTEPPASADAVSPLQQYGYIRAYRAIMRDCDLVAAILYGLLEDYAQIGARTGRGAVPSQSVLAEKLGVTRETVRVKLNLLREHGWVTWESGAERSEPNSYVLPVRSIRKHEVPENLVQGAANSGTNYQERASSSSRNLEDESGASVSVSRSAPRRTQIDPAWRPDRNTAAGILDQTGWGQAKLDAEIVKFIRWHQEKGTKNVDWRAAFRKWVQKAIDIDKDRGRRDDSGGRRPGRLVV